MLLRCWWCGVVWGGVGWDVYVPCTSYISCCYAVEISGIVATSHVVTLLMVWGLKDLQDWKNLARWQRLASEKYKNFGFFCMGTKIECFDHCKFMKTTTKSCKYQWKCKSCQNANVTKPWKGCKTEDWAAGKKVKLRGVIAGGVSLFLGSPPFAPLDS